MKYSLKEKVNYVASTIKESVELEWDVFSARKNRNKYIFNDASRLANPRGVNVHYWKPREGDNLGDYLSLIVCDYLCEVNGISSAVELDAPRHLYAIGSILGFGCQDAVVWGSGTLGPCKQYERRIKRSTLDIRCIRGPKTRQYLLQLGVSCPAIYGDPAILMPLIYTPPKAEKKYEYAIIPHIWDSAVSLEDQTICLIDMKSNDYERIINRIAESKIVISSSLHGIILAEAYGVPAIYLRGGQNDFKYEDYYLSTGREMKVVAKTIKQAMNIDPMALPQVDELTRNLIQTFPRDLWEENHV